TSETATIQARVPVTASLEDDDSPTNITWQWARSRSSTSGWANIAGATNATFTPADGDIGGYLRATASYNDGEGSGKTAVRVSPRVGQAPPVNSAPAFPATERGQREVAEDATGGTAVGDPVVANDFNNDQLTYSLSGTDAALFTIDSSTGQIRVANGADLDFETKRTLRVTVEVGDGMDPLGDRDDPNDPSVVNTDDRQNVTITLTDVNEAPVVTGDDSPSVAENLNRAVATYTGTDPERDTLTWSVSTDDFWISQRGQLHFAAPPSYERGSSYPVTITVEDEDGLSDSLFVTVTVTDVEEAGVVTVEPWRGWDGTAFQVELDDDDGNVSNESWQWQRSSNRSSWTDIAGATSRNYTATTDDIGRYLRAVASYEDDRGGSKEASAEVTGRIGDANDRPSTNNAPEFADTTAERSIGQGTAAGRNIGAPVRATDMDSDDVLTYSLSGSHADLFDIDPATGQIKTKAVLDYDPEGTNEYDVTIDVHDGFNSSYSPSPSSDDSITVTIIVTQVAQRSSSGGGGGGGGFGPAPTAPKFVDGFRTTRPLAVNAREGAAVGDPVAATHPNDDDVTYSLSGANATLFTVDEATGQIRLGAAVTLELGETYTVNVTAVDESGTGALIIVVIEVVEGPADPYDLNGNGTIEKNEVIMAVSDYFAGLIDKETVVALLARYFAG
ncbi:MAG: cadherin domain-containing protein, partial [Chloroflexota bacterium]|nr:cadherin domain-containing protein [Chloroflexota bacterium]